MTLPIFAGITKWRSTLLFDGGNFVEELLWPLLVGNFVVGHCGNGQRRDLAPGGGGEELVELRQRLVEDTVHVPRGLAEGGLAAWRL